MAFSLQILLSMALFSVALSADETVPVDAFRKLMQLDNVKIKELIAKTLENPPARNPSSGGVITGVRPASGPESSSFLESFPAALKQQEGCTPRNVSVEVPPDSNPGWLMVPKCVIVPRCSGCCGHESLACLPDSTEMASYRVYKMQIDASTGQPTDVRVLDQRFEKHNSCKCQCKVQPEDCRADRHIYEENFCRCKCKNEGQAALCPSNKIWDTEQCACVCINYLFCPEHEHYDMATCSCQAGSSPVGSGQLPSVDQGTQTGQNCPNVQCRAGYRVAADCTCTSSSNWGKDVEEAGGGNLEPQEQSTTTTMAPSTTTYKYMRPRPRPRPRPRSRNAGR